MTNTQCTQREREREREREINLNTGSVNPGQLDSGGIFTVKTVVRRVWDREDALASGEETGLWLP